ncbi:MAG: hypothetical protein DRN20_03450 [Thermoplasmata archaeon]|nr:MAG: hypothetical protein DRN20_03450 [Thermoplasmata archaeon]
MISIIEGIEEDAQRVLKATSVLRKVVNPTSTTQRDAREGLIEVLDKVANQLWSKVKNLKGVSRIA